jgi:hypothetical protein
MAGEGWMADGWSMGADYADGMAEQVLIKRS